MADQEENGERTEEASPRKREEMRKQGSFARSHDLDQSVVLLGALTAISLIGTMLVQRQISLFQNWMPTINSQRPILDIIRDQLPNAVLPLILPVAGIIGLAALFAMVAQIFQAGFQLHPELAMPKWDRIDPLGGIKKLFSMQSVITGTFGVLKLTIVGFVAYRALSVVLLDAPGWWQLPVQSMIPLGLAMMTKIAWSCTTPLLIIGAADYGVRWWKTEQEMKMTKQEVKEENKQQEGDPQIKHRIRQIARAKLMKRMIADVPKSTVIVCNPTHVAIALKYEAGMPAPLVMAKGEDHMALHIKKIAADAGVPIIEEPPLARALLRTVQVGQSIPVEFYRAVAEILAVIYRSKQTVARGLPTPTMNNANNKTANNGRTR